MGHSGSTVGRYILIYTRQGRAGRVEGMQRVSCESRGDVKDRHNEIRLRPRKPDGVRVSSARLSRRSGPRARASRPSPPNVGVDRIRLVRTMSNARFLAANRDSGALSLTACADGDAPVCRAVLSTPSLVRTLHLSPNR